MKTKIKTILPICALGFIGIININATVDYKKTANTEVVENLKNMSNTIDEDLNASNGLEIDVRFETYSTVQFLLNEDLDAEVDFQKEAQSVTRWIVDQEEAKVLQKFAAEEEINQFESVQISLSEDSDANVDFQNEAQLVTKQIVDQKEARVVKMFIDQGKLEEMN